MTSYVKGSTGPRDHDDYRARDFDVVQSPPPAPEPTHRGLIEARTDPDGAFAATDAILHQLTKERSVPRTLAEYEAAKTARLETAATAGVRGLPTEAKARKDIPIFSGFLAYFPLACAAVAELSRKGNDQHNPGKPLHWDRSKSGDEADALGRHFLEHGTIDTDGVRHSTKVAWRAMALLQKELEAAERGAPTA